MIVPEMRDLERAQDGSSSSSTAPGTPSGCRHAYRVEARSWPAGVGLVRCKGTVLEVLSGEFGGIGGDRGPKHLLLRMVNSKDRAAVVHISFDFDEDQTLKHFFAGQFKLPESPFVAADWSMKEAAPQVN